ncbi:MAG: right-handed parallel beta-helix repeat-containing protein [Ardenticatenales bacterium]
MRPSSPSRTSGHDPRRISIALALLATAAAFSSPAVRAAATITVCPTGCDHPTLGAAVQAAVEGDTIEVGAGNYPAGVAVDKAITIRGAGPEQTVLNGGGRTAVLALRNTTGRATIENLTLTGGTGVAIEHQIYGAGLYIKGKAATARNIVVRDNHSARDGGGIYIDAGDVTLVDVIVKDNSAGNAGGGVFANDGGTLTMIGGEISHNIARNPDKPSDAEDTNARGAGLMSEVNATVTGTVIKDNESATQGGGVYCVQACKMTMTEVTIAGNKAQRGAGVMNASTLTIERSTVTGNQAAEYGGGVFNFNRLTVLESEIVDNTSEKQGAGIANLSGFAASQVGLLTVTRSTIAGNRARGDGGGLWQSIDADNPPQLPESTIDRSTFSGNAALSGAGVYLDIGRIDITDCTIAANLSHSGAGVGTNVDNALRVGGTILNNEDGDNCDGKIASTGNNLDGDGSCAFQNRGDVVSSRVELGPLADNGGYTRTHAIGADSAAIDAGNPGRCAQKPLDQRGAVRPVDGDGDGTKVCDIGAFEYGAEIPGTATPTPTRTATGPATTPPDRTATPAPSPTFVPPDETPSATPTFVDGDPPTPRATNTAGSAWRVFMPYSER